MTFIRNISGVPYLDEARLWAQVSQKEVPVSERLREIMKLVGVRFYDEQPGEYNFVSQPCVAITGIGGLPLSFDDKTPNNYIEIMGSAVTPEKIIAALRERMGITGFYSAANSGNHSPAAMNGMTTRLGHLSKAHAVTVDMSVFGYSAAIEGNMMMLRRWFNHVGRMTNTRISAQSNPPLVVLDPDYLSSAMTVRQAIATILETIARPSLEGLNQEQRRERLADHFECVNSMWPNSRALMVTISADLKNLSATMGDIGDLGQELEQRRILAMINDMLVSLFPELFKHSSTYGYEMPHHWPARATWEQQRDAAMRHG